MLRRGLHAVHSMPDGGPDVNKCLLAPMESLRLEAVEAKAGWDKSEKKNIGLRRENA